VARAAIARNAFAVVAGSVPDAVEHGRFLAVLESHKASLLEQRADIEAQLSEIQAFEKKVRKQLKRS
jgi:outer membrane protein TolC